MPVSSCFWAWGRPFRLGSKTVLSSIQHRAQMAAAPFIPRSSTQSSGSGPWHRAQASSAEVEPAPSVSWLSRRVVKRGSSSASSEWTNSRGGTCFPRPLKCCASGHVAQCGVPSGSRGIRFPAGVISQWIGWPQLRQEVGVLMVVRLPARGSLSDMPHR